MDISLFYGLGGCLVGGLIGWLIASLCQQRTKAQQDIERRLLEQAMQQAHQNIAEFQVVQQRNEQQLRQNELEQRNLHSQLAVNAEKLHQLVHWSNECSQLNQELRAQREVNSVQEAELREVTTRLEETRLAAEDGRDQAPRA